MIKNETQPAMNCLTVVLVATVVISFLAGCTSHLFDGSLRDFSLRQMLLDDIGISSRPSVQVYMLERSPRLDPGQQANLAAYYYVGLGVDEDVTKAADLFAKAAEAGNSKAQLCLAVLYSKGQGVKQTDTEAYKWLLLAGRSTDKYGKTANELAELLSKDLSLGRQEIARSLAETWLTQHSKPNEEKRWTDRKAN